MKRYSAIILNEAKEQLVTRARLFLCFSLIDTKQRFIKVRLGLKDSALDPNDAEVQKNFLKQVNGAADSSEAKHN